MKRQAPIFVTKSSGLQVEFDQGKLRHSLQKSKASASAIEIILTEIEHLLYDGISTKEIYKKAFQLLKRKNNDSAARYKLKNALLELGPTGFPFEKYVGELFRFKGYEVEVGKKIQGACVQHEVDVVAEKNGKITLVECKFHSDPNRSSDVKVPLYIYSRFADILDGWNKNTHENKDFFTGKIYTNTRFTSDAIQYAKCKGMDLVGWDYPEKGSLKERIDISGLYPITCLTKLTMDEKQRLLDSDIVLIKSLCLREDLLRKIGITNDKRIHQILREASEICNQN
ncbi:MAG: restriction endonuclease [Crocinitomicaceae bacterium]